MSVSISASFKLVVEELKNNCMKEILLNRFDFKQLLNTTNAIERYLIAKIFCRLPWNIGSLRVLAVLQELSILTATEFILSLENNEQIQLILNDFLEAEYELLANLFISSKYDVTNNIRLNSILDECLLALFKDLIQNPSLNDLSYLTALKTLLPADVLTKVALKHVEKILEQHKSNIKTAFMNFSNWINEGVDSLSFTKTLQKLLISDIEEDILKHLFKLSSREHFNEWKYYLILLQTIACSCKANSTTFIRKYLKSRVKEIAALSNKQLVLHMLLTARAATATTTDLQKNIDAYAEWYRQNIAEMKFVLKLEDFQNVCTILEQCVSYEMEEYYLDVHATISISPPLLCAKIVQGYKNKCKFRLSQIKNKNSETLEPGDDSIILDSD